VIRCRSSVAEIKEGKKVARLMFLDGKVVAEPPADKNAKEPPPPT
jgi:hypothetical protein